jgi:hypothetical protein
MRIELHGHKSHHARWDLPVLRKRTMQQPHEEQIEGEPEAVGRASTGFHLKHVLRRQPKAAP